MTNQTTTFVFKSASTFTTTLTETSTISPQQPAGVYVVITFLVITACIILGWYLMIVCGRVRNGIRTFSMRRGYNRRLTEADNDDFENPIYQKTSNYSSAAI